VVEKFTNPEPVACQGLLHVGVLQRRGFAQAVTEPSLIWMVWAVTRDASSEASLWGVKNSITPLTSGFLLDRERPDRRGSGGCRTS
jgi:hypothetical protein